MITVRTSEERGVASHGWLESRHTFSFGSYHDPEQMGFRSLRVINDDRVVAKAGFPAHSHRDMEIVSYVVDGAMEHEDSMGNGSVMRPGDVQRMSAGTGVTHSEFNHSATEALRFLQIWILPERQGIEPGYEQQRFSEEQRRNQLRLVVSPTGEHGSIRVHQNVRMFSALLEAGHDLSYQLAASRHAWLQMISGSVSLGSALLQEGDGARVSSEDSLHFAARSDSHFLLFDLA